jgi:hypothetical protein
MQNNIVAEGKYHELIPKDIDNDSHRMDGKLYNDGRYRK